MKAFDVGTFEKMIKDLSIPIPGKDIANCSGDYLDEI